MLLFCCCQLAYFVGMASLLLLDAQCHVVPCGWKLTMVYTLWLHLLVTCFDKAFLSL